MREEEEAQTISGAGRKSPQGHKVFVLQKSLNYDLEFEGDKISHEPP